MDFEVNLPVPYHSQEDPDDNVTRDTCGPTSVAMVFDFYGESHSGDEVFQQTGAGSGLISVQQLLTAIEAFGFKAEYKTGLQFSDIQNYLKQGIAPIALVKAQYLTSRQDQGFGGGHFIVIDGFRNDGITANDPDFYGSLRPQGDHHFYTMPDFLAAWGKCHEDGNPDNSVIIIYPKTQDSSSDQNTINVQKSVQFDESLTPLNQANSGIFSSTDSRQYFSTDPNTPNNGFVKAITAFCADYLSNRQRAGQYDIFYHKYDPNADTTKTSADDLAKLVDSTWQGHLDDLQRQFDEYKQAHPDIQSTPEVPPAATNQDPTTTVDPLTTMTTPPVNKLEDPVNTQAAENTAPSTPSVFSTSQASQGVWQKIIAYIKFW